MDSHTSKETLAHTHLLTPSDTLRYGINSLAGCVLFFNAALEKACATGKPSTEVEWKELLSEEVRNTGANDVQ